MHPADRDKVAGLIANALSTGESLEAEVSIVRPNRTIRRVYLRGEVVTSADDAIVGLSGTVHDITEQRETERVAEQTKARLAEEHHVLVLLQRSLMPPKLPEMAGVELAAIYLAAAERVDIGGDWYDAFGLPDGRLALAVGDVTGHDLRAATVMAQVRNALRAYAMEDADPGQVLARLNRLLVGADDLDLVTMLYGVYDPVAGTLTWSRAGHLPPVLRTEDGAYLLDDPPGVILGVSATDGPYPAAETRLAPGDLLVWYTDGLIERRGRDIVTDLRRLRNAVGSRPVDDVAEMIDAVVDEFVEDQPQDDDICMLALARPR